MRSKLETGQAKHRRKGEFLLGKEKTNFVLFNKLYKSRKVSKFSPIFQEMRRLKFSVLSRLQKDPSV